MSTLAWLLLALCTEVASQDCSAATQRSKTTKGENVDPPRSLVEVHHCQGAPLPQDCKYCPLTDTHSITCSAWATEGTNPAGVRWPLITSYIIGAAMAWGIGGTDAANSLATSVGSGALSLRAATIMGAVGEFLGATLLGAGVSGTIQKGVADIFDSECWACGYCNSRMDQYQFGMLAALCGAAFFLLVVTFRPLPWSTTHAVVGGVIGMTIAAIGSDCLNWSLTDGLGKITVGWVVSPLVSGAIGSIMYMITYYFIMRTKDPKLSSLRSVPILYGASFAMMSYLTLMKAPLTKQFITATVNLQFITVTVNLLVSLVVFVLVAIASQFKVVPQMRAELQDMERREVDARANPGGFRPTSMKASQPWEALSKLGSFTSRSSISKLRGDGSAEGVKVLEMQTQDSTALSFMAKEEESPGLVIFTQSPPSVAQSMAKRVFKNLLVMTAFIKCVGHGANDTANATGAMGAVQFLYDDGIHTCSDMQTSTAIMAIAGLLVGVGVMTMGYRVIQALGSDLTDIDFHVGFCVEFASAAAVVIATTANLPVSTTHCQIGAIVFVGATAYGKDTVAWSMVGRIAVTWIATLPAAGGVAYILMWLRYA